MKPQIAMVRAQVLLSLFTDFENFRRFKPDLRHQGEINSMLDQRVAWSDAFKSLRERRPQKAPWA